MSVGVLAVATKPWGIESGLAAADSFCRSLMLIVVVMFLASSENALISWNVTYVYQQSQLSNPALIFIGVGCANSGGSSKDCVATADT
jgi:hypothetical protein